MDLRFRNRAIWATFSALVLAMVQAMASVPAAAAPAQGKAEGGLVANTHSAAYRDGNVIVAFRPGTSAAAEAQSLSDVSAHLERRYQAGAQLLHVPKGRVPAVVASLEAQTDVLYAEPDWETELAAVPNDPGFPQQWGFQNTGQVVNGTSGTPHDDESATSAWNINTGSSSVVIGELDTGVDYTHPDLAANMWTNPGGIGGCAAGTHGYNVLTATCDPMDDDSVYGGHGTHVAGIMGAVGNNGSGVTGVNWTTTILPVKWVDSSGNGATSGLLAGLDWLLQAKAAGVNIRIVNDSDVFKGTAYSQALADEISLLGQNNVLFVTAGGNTSDNNDNPALRRYPCAYDLTNEICVMASDQNDSRPSWANYGPTTVDLAAPGNNIYSTLRGGGYGFISGSSMAAPQVSGTAALILSQAGNSGLTASQIKARILESVDPIPGLSGVVRTGGRLNVCRALGGCPAQPATATFGYTAVGPKTDSATADVKKVNRYNLGTPGQLSKLSIYLYARAKGSQALEGVVYADSNGKPGALLGTTQAITYSSTQGSAWHDLPFASALSLSAGTYWIGYLAGGTSGVAGTRWTSVSGSRAYDTNSYSAGPSDPFGSPTTDSEQTSLYATYTTTSISGPFDITPPPITPVPSQTAHPSPEPQQGVGLSAGTGDWDGSPLSFSYQWWRCAATSGSCSTISGATTNTYLPVAADVGSTLQVEVSATAQSGTTKAMSVPTLVVQGPVSGYTFGKTTVGATDDLSTNDWERVDSFALPQAGSVSKLTVYLDRQASGSQAFVGVIYADAGGTPGALLAQSSSVTFSTTASSGWMDLPLASPLSLGAGTYWIGIQAGATGNVTALRYDESTAGSGAVAPAPYSSGPLNPFGTARIQTEQISIYASYVPGSTTSVAPTNSSPPTVSGTPAVGAVLTASTGTWSNNPTSYRYQWLTCPSSGCVTISGATGSSYTPTSADVGNHIQVSVTATNSAGSTTAASSAVGPVTSQSTVSTAGTTAVGPNPDTMSADRKRVNQIHLTTSASVSKLSMYLQPTSTSGAESIEGLIYADSGGTPSALVATTGILTFSSSDSAGWYDLTFPSTVSLAAGTYWIGVISGGTAGVAGFRWTSVSGSRDWNTNTFSAGPTSTFGSPTIDAEEMSLYATYSTP